MTSYPKPLDFRIRVGGLKSLNNAPFEIDFEIDSSFILKNIFDKLNSIIDDDPYFSDMQHIVYSEIGLIRLAPELQIFENDSTATIIKKGYENEPFIADLSNLKVSWESDRYVMKNQSMKVIELFQNRKYVMIIKNRSKNSYFISALIFKPFIFSLNKSKRRLAVTDILEHAFKFLC